MRGGKEKLRVGEKAKALAAAGIAALGITGATDKSPATAQTHDPSLRFELSREFVTPLTRMSSGVDAFLKRHKDKIFFNAETGEITVRIANGISKGKGPVDRERVSEVMVRASQDGKIISLNYQIKEAGRIIGIEVLNIREENNGELTVDGALDFETGYDEIIEDTTVVPGGEEGTRPR
ncbi:MAG: hypothetical protein Q7S50_03315 [bacterium]|nr:hypothetical protein [bacterium]